MNIQQQFLPFENPPSSLHWEDDHLIDWVRRGDRYYLDGRFEDNHWHFAFPFDAAEVTPCGKYAVVYQTYGTKGIVMHGNKKVREINRSYYCADRTPYPLALFNLPNDEPAILHCPDEYNQLEIEHLLTGERLTSTPNRQPTDYFWRGLKVCPSGRFALSEGWAWAPVDILRVINLPRGLDNPHHLDGHDNEVLAEIHSAVFINDHQLIIASEVDNDAGQMVNALQLYDIKANAFLQNTLLPPPCRLRHLLPIDEHYVWDLGATPQVLNTKTGQVAVSLPAVPGEGRVVVAQHPDRKRLALGTNEGIHFLTLEG